MGSRDGRGFRAAACLMQLHFDLKAPLLPEASRDCQDAHRLASHSQPASGQASALHPWAAMVALCALGPRSHVLFFPGAAHHPWVEHSIEAEQQKYQDDARYQAKCGRLGQGYITMSLCSTWSLRSCLLKASRPRFRWERVGLLTALVEGRILFKRGLPHI